MYDDSVKVDWLFVDQQLQKYDFSPAEDVLVRKVLHVLEQAGLSQEELANFAGVLDVVEALLNGHALSSPSSNEQWRDALPGDIVKRDRVRVKHDAYSGSVGVHHNGKEGRVASILNGKVTVVYDGESAEGAPRHEVRALQKLV